MERDEFVVFVIKLYVSICESHWRNFRDATWWIARPSFGVICMTLWPKCIGETLRQNPRRAIGHQWRRRFWLKLCWQRVPIHYRLPVQCRLPVVGFSSELCIAWYFPPDDWNAYKETSCMFICIYMLWQFQGTKMRTVINWYTVLQSFQSMYAGKNAFQMEFPFWCHVSMPYA